MKIKMKVGDIVRFNDGVRKGVGVVETIPEKNSLGGYYAIRAYSGALLAMYEREIEEVNTIVCLPLTEQGSNIRIYSRDY